MPARNPELPEGTDHIINGAMETGAGTGASTGSSGGGAGFVGGGGDDTGGTSLGGGTTVTYASAAGGGAGGGASGGGAGGGGGASGGGASGGGASGGGASGGGGGGASGGEGFDGGAPIKQQLRDGVDTVRQQAGEKIRTYALTGKDKATTALDDLSQVVSDAAAQIDDRLGAQYGDYARRAADTVSDFAETLRNKEVDELFDDARQIVRKSPGLAIGAAAVVGFTLVRLVKAGLDNDGGGNVNFKPEGGRNIEFQPEGGSGGSGSGTGA